MRTNAAPITTHLPVPRVLILVAILAFAVALAAFAYVGTFTRYMADDYCLSADVHRLGFVHAQTNLYLTWTGRYSYNFLMSLAELIGPATVPIGPLAILICWLGAATWSIYQIAVMTRWQYPVLSSLMIAGLIIFAMLNGADNIVQSVYWQGGLVNYVVPLVLLSIYAGIIFFAARKQPPRHRWLLFFLGGMLTFIAAGLTEAYGVMQTGGLVLAVAGCYKYASKPLRHAVLPLLVIGLLASAIGLIIVTMAPGNVFRQDHFPPPPGVFRLAAISAYYSAGFIVYQLLHSPLNVLLLILAPAGLASLPHQTDSNQPPTTDERRFNPLVLWLPVIGFFLIFLCFLTGVYATSGALPERARFIPQFVFVVTTVCCAYAAGIALRKMTSRNKSKPKLSSFRTATLAVAAVIVFLTPVLSTWRTLRLVPRARAGAVILDQMDRDIRVAKAQGLMDLTVPAMDDLETRLGARRTELQVERDPNQWKNKCMASYYGVKSITAR